MSLTATNGLGKVSNEVVLNSAASPIPVSSDSVDSRTQVAIEQTELTTPPAAAASNNFSAIVIPPSHAAIAKIANLQTMIPTPVQMYSFDPGVTAPNSYAYEDGTRVTILGTQRMYTFPDHSVYIANGDEISESFNTNEQNNPPRRNPLRAQRLSERQSRTACHNRPSVP